MNTSVLYSAMRNPTRAKIVDYLGKAGKEVPNELLLKKLKIPKANLSQSLIVMKNANLVKFRREGRKLFISLTDDRLVDLQEVAKSIGKRRN